MPFFADKSRGKRGKAAEALMDAACDWYRFTGQANIVPSYPQWKVLGWNPKTQTAAKVFPAGKGGVDRYGTLKGGRGIYFDVKEEHGGRFELKNIREGQLEFLVAMRDLGAVSFLLVVMVPEERTYLVRPELVQRALGTHKLTSTGRVVKKGSLSLAELEAQAIRVPYKDGLPDFLAALAQKEE